MEVIIILVFIAGYIVIAFEHSLNVNKTATALLTGVICWTLFMLATPSDVMIQSSHFSIFEQNLKHELGDLKFSALTSSEIYHDFVSLELGRHLVSISEILFFLLGAMTIVELIDAHNGF